MTCSILLGKSKNNQEVNLLGVMANRHGLIAGSTGTGKTVSLKVLAEGFSSLGVPVFLADVKGDLAGISQCGKSTTAIQERSSQLQIAEPAFQDFPVMFWDLLGEQGHPVRATISDMGPLLISRLLNLNDTQSAVLTLAFRFADDQGLLLLDLKDLRALLQHIGENTAQFTTEYGNISTASIGAIQRGLLLLEEQGGDKFFGEPALNIADFEQTDAKGRGYINILAADKLLQSPKIYSMFLLWLLAELFENLPEVGDVEKPKMVFFFDEAHLLFDEASKALLEKIEQVVRLIRSKGVGIYFVTQNPLDIPDTVLGQLGNRVQHALRAFTARDQKAVKAAAETFRANEEFDTETAITELAIGEALVSLLDSKGTPTPVERVMIIPPASRLGPITSEERKSIIAKSLVAQHYEKSVDRESAYERLKNRTEHPALTEEESLNESKARNPSVATSATASQRESAPVSAAAAPRQAGRQRQGALEAFFVTTARSVGSQVGRQIVRGVLGTLFGRATRR